MARLIDRLLSKAGDEARGYQLGDWLDDLATSQLMFGGSNYMATSLGGQLGTAESAGSAFAEKLAIPSNGVVFSCVMRRATMFAQARFVYKKFGVYRPMTADMVTNSSLAPLDEPYPILARVEVDIAKAGNAYLINDGGVIRRLEPEYVDIVIGSDSSPNDSLLAADASVIGYVYRPPGHDPEPFMVSDVAHFAPYPDPDAQYRGMSYLRPILSDISTDNAGRAFLGRFFKQGATPNTVVGFPREVQLAEIQAFKKMYEERHEGVGQAFKTAFLGGGADLKVIGSSLKELDAEHVTAGVHAAICAAAMVPPILVGVLPGLDSSTMANYNMALRSFSDMTIRPLWGQFTTSLRRIMPRLGGHELWYDVSGVSALQEDAKDDAAVVTQQVAAARQLIEAGFTPESAIQAVVQGDLSAAKHTGLVSVQLQEPGASVDPGTVDSGATSD